MISLSSPCPSSAMKKSSHNVVDVATQHQGGHQPLTQALVEVDSYITLMPKYNSFKVNTTFWSEVGKKRSRQNGSRQTGTNSTSQAHMMGDM